MQDLVIATNTFCDPKYRTNYYQFLSRHYNYRFLRDTFGCKAGWRVDKSAREHINRNNGVALWKPKLGRHKTPEELQTAVKSFLINNSRLSSQNTTEEIDGVVVPCRHLDDSVSGLYLEYALNTDDSIVSESTFRNLIEQFKIFGDAHQDTDMCGYCLRGVQLKKLIKPLYDKYEIYQMLQILSRDNGEDDVDMKIEEAESHFDGIPVLSDGNNTEKYLYPLQNLLNYVHISDEFDDAAEQLWTERLRNFHVIMNHRWDKKQVNEQYKRDIENPPENTIVIVADFKQNMVIGRSQIEVSEAYRQSREPRSVLGFHVATPSGRYFVDYISDCTSKTSAYAVQCIRHLCNTNWIKTLVDTDNIRNVIIWTDRGTHFMDKHNMYYWLCELLWEFDWVDNVKYNFFVEKHGKSIVDGHFGLLGYYYRSYCKSSKTGVFCTNDLRHALLSGHNKAQRIKEHRNSLRKDNGMNNDDDTNDIHMKCVNFDLDIDNEYVGVCAASKEDEVHAQYCLEIPNLQSFGSYKVFKNINREKNLKSYNSMRIDSDLHKNMYHYDSDESNKENYDIMNRFDFGLQRSELDELDKVKYRPYQYEIFASGQAYHNLYLSRCITCKLGIGQSPRISKTAKKKRVPPAKTKSLLTRQKHRHNLLNRNKR